MLESRNAGENAPVATQNTNQGNVAPQQPAMPAMEESFPTDTDDLPF